MISAKSPNAGLWFCLWKKCTAEGSKSKNLAMFGDTEPGRASIWQVGNLFFVGVDSQHSGFAPLSTVALIGTLTPFHDEIIHINALVSPAVLP